MASGNSTANDYMSNENQLLQNQAALSGLQLQNYQTLSPQITQLQQAQLGKSLANTQNPVYDWMRTQSNNLTSQMPSYNSNLGLDSPETQKFADLYNKSLDAQMAQQQRNLDNNTAAGNLFGSSYEAGNQAALGNLKAQNEAQNQVSALSNAQGNQSNNLNTWTSLLATMLGTPSYSTPTAPTLPSSSGLGNLLASSNLGQSNMLSGLMKSATPAISSAISSAANNIGSSLSGLGGSGATDAAGGDLGGDLMSMAPEAAEFLLA